MSNHLSMYHCFVIGVVKILFSEEFTFLHIILLLQSLYCSAVYENLSPDKTVILQLFTILSLSLSLLFYLASCNHYSALNFYEINFWIFHLSDRMWYLSLYASLILLNSHVKSRLIYVVTNDKISSFIAE